MSPRLRFVAALLPAAAAALLLAAGTDAARDGGQDGVPDYNRDVRPILSQHCFACHGPDRETREADLRLDTFDGATADLGGYAAVVPGDPEASELVYRVSTTDAEDHMPPSETEKSLSETEIDVLTRWIAAGAEYQRHWSFVPPARTPLPQVEDAESFVRTPVDAFTLARMEAVGLDPSPIADRRTLLRRAAQDLTGLPPEPELLESFLADDAPGAWERAVDALLASPRYGERMAAEWLDLARYADTHGYHIDSERTMWPWRDHIIRAFNDNQPFDRFTVEALAGDLLPEPSREQLVASGFHRNHMINFEGGAIAAEYLNEYVVDRVNTTSKVWMGLTMGCAQCHDHKYDPLPQDDFYRFYAYFNTIDEKGLDGQNGNADPKIPVPTPEQDSRIADFGARIAAIEADLAAPDAETLAALADWVAAERAQLEQLWALPEPAATASDHEQTTFTWSEGVLTARGAAADVEDYLLEFPAGDIDWRVLRVEVLPGADGAEYPRSGRATNGNFVLSELEVEVVRDGVAEAVPLAGAYADHAQPNYAARLAVDGDLGTGWAADAHNRREARVLDVLAAEPFGAGADAVRVHLRFRYGTAHSFARMRLAFSGDAAAAASLEPLDYGTWSFAEPRDGVQDATAVPEWQQREDFVDGQVHSFEPVVGSFFLKRSFDAPAATTRLWSLGSDDGIRVVLNGETLLDNPAARAVAADQEQLAAPLRAGRNDLLLEVDNFGGAAGFYFRELEAKPRFAGPVLSALWRGDADSPAVRELFLSRHWEPWIARMEELRELREERAALLASVPTVMVMREAEMPRKTFVLHRGEYDQPRGEVSPGLPEALLLDDAGAATEAGGDPTAGMPSDRLGLAEWLVDPRHPLTARVQVNRLWAQMFGHGLVRTPEDFGAQGDWPTHPELLDWLAVEYVESGWDTKAMLKLLATSATYMQSSALTPELLQMDPENRLLARGPRFRLSAEAIRDQALAASGLLVEKLGGPSVKPYQPDGLWREVAYGGGNAGRSASVFVQDSGEDLYRRSLYTFRKRSSPPPQLATFDAPNRELCVVQRSRTNTPLQALVLLNDPTYLEASRVLAARVMQEEPGTRARVDRLYERVIGRAATDAEAAILLELVAERYAYYAAAPAEADALLSAGEFPRAEGLDAAEHAAWACAAVLVFNLDEAVTRG